MVRHTQWVQARVLVGEIPMLLETIAVWQIVKSEKIKTIISLLGLFPPIALKDNTEANKMLDIISMIAFEVIFIGLPILLILIGGSNKTEEEQRLEDEEQMKYLKEYQEKNK